MTKYKKGDKVTITANHSSHEFDIGEVVELEEYFPRLNGGRDTWRAGDIEDEYWYIVESDFKIK